MRSLQKLDDELFCSIRDSFILWFITAKKPEIFPYESESCRPREQKRTPLRDIHYSKPHHEAPNAKRWMSDLCQNWRQFTSQPSRMHLKITFHGGNW